MQNMRAAVLCLIAVLCAGNQGMGAAAPKIDRAFLESYIRYAEGFTQEVKFTIDDPTATAFPGYYRLLVHLNAGDSHLDKVYYLGADGKSLVAGSIWDLSRNPFVEAVKQIPTDGPSFGPADAKVTLVVFSDFECPYCREFARTMRSSLPQKYPKDVRVIFKDFPIDSIHPWASAAAEAAHCMTKQKPEVFWPFHDWIFLHQGEVNPENVKEKTLEFAKGQGLDATKAASCIDSHEMRPVVAKSLQEGRQLQIEKTPTFFVNGRMVAGALSWPSLSNVIELELKRPANIPALPAEKCCEVPAPGGTN